MGYRVLRPKCCDKHAQWWWIIQFASLRLPPPLGTQDTWSTCPWRSFRRWGWIALPSAEGTTDHRTHQCLDMFRKEKVGDSVFLLETFYEEIHVWPLSTRWLKETQILEWIRLKNEAMDGMIVMFGPGKEDRDLQWWGKFAFIAMRFLE